MNNSTRSRIDDIAEVQETEKAPKDEKPALELSLTQILGGALAAMTAAALGSTLGVAGTIVGAAFASIVAGVAGALYTASLRRTQERVKTVFVGRGAAVTPVEIDEPTPAVPIDQPPRSFPWKGALVVALSVFALAAVAITGVEALTGRSLSGGEGTTVQQVGDGTVPTERKPSAQPSAQSTPSALEASPTLSASADPSASVSPSVVVGPSASASTSPTATAPSSLAPTPSGSVPAPSAPVS